MMGRDSLDLAASSWNVTVGLTFSSSLDVRTSRFYLKMMTVEPKTVLHCMCIPRIPDG